MDRSRGTECQILGRVKVTVCGDSPEVVRAGRRCINHIGEDEMNLISSTVEETSNTVTSEISFRLNTCKI